MVNEYLEALRNRFEQIRYGGTANKIESMFSCFCNTRERLWKTCRVVWAEFEKRIEDEPSKNTLSFFANPNEMEQVLECFLSILLASKKEGVEPLTPDEIKSRWENGGDIVLCMKLGERYRKSIYTISDVEQSEYKRTGECQCLNVRNNNNNKKIVINPDRHLVYPASFSVNVQPLRWNYYLCNNKDAAYFHEHTKLETPIFIFDHSTTAEKVLSSIMIGGVSAWECFSVVNVRRDGDIRSISSMSDPSIFIFSSGRGKTEALRCDPRARA